MAFAWRPRTEQTDTFVRIYPGRYPQRTSDAGVQNITHKFCTSTSHCACFMKHITCDNTEFIVVIISPVAFQIQSGERMIQCSSLFVSSMARVRLLTGVQIFASSPCVRTEFYSPGAKWPEDEVNHSLQTRRH